MKKATLIPALIALILLAQNVSCQQRTRNPFAVGFQFDRHYYEPNSSGNVKIWVISWVEQPLFIDAVFIHFDWMEEDEFIKLVALNASVKQYEPVVVGSLNFTVPNVEKGWYGYIALVHYSLKAGKRWIRGVVRAPDPADEREFGHEEYLISVGYQIGEGKVPALYWEICNYTREVRRGDYFNLWVDLGNIGGYYAPSIHAALINDLGELVFAIKPVNIYSGISQPYPLLFLSEGVPYGLRARLIWKIPENYPLGSHNMTLLIISGQVPQASKVLNFTILKSYSEEVKEKLDFIERFLSGMRGLQNVSSQAGLKLNELEVLKIWDEYEAASNSLMLGEEKLALEHANKGLELVSSIIDKLKPFVAKIESEISSLRGSRDPRVIEHVQRASTFLSRARSSDDPVCFVNNLTMAAQELISAKSLVKQGRFPLILVAIFATLGTILIFLIRKIRSSHA